MSVRVVVVAGITAGLALVSATLVSDAAGTLDYDFYKAKVQPIFLAKRAGHAPCAMCHAGANNMLHLEELPPGADHMDRGPDAQEFRHGLEDRSSR